MKFAYIVFEKILHWLYLAINYEQSIKWALLFRHNGTKDGKALKRTMLIEHITGKSTAASNQYWEYWASIRISNLAYSISKKRKANNGMPF